VDVGAETVRYRRALAFEPDDDMAKSFLASAHVSLGQYREAVPLLEQVRQRATGQARIRAAQALALAHLAIRDEPGPVRVLESEGVSGQQLAGARKPARTRKSTRRH